jgi:hypothetical protein
MSKNPCTCMDDIEGQLDEMCIAFKAHMMVSDSTADIAKFMAFGVRMQAFAIALTTRAASNAREGLIDVVTQDYRATLERSIQSFETVAAEYELEQGAPKQ